MSGTVCHGAKERPTDTPLRPFTAGLSCVPAAPFPFRALLNPNARPRSQESTNTKAKGEARMKQKARAGKTSTLKRTLSVHGPDDAEYEGQSAVYNKKRRTSSGTVTIDGYN